MKTMKNFENVSQPAPVGAGRRRARRPRTGPRRRAAAVCVRAGVVQGDENGLRPADAFTRAEFAKILLTIADQG